MASTKGISSTELSTLTASTEDNKRWIVFGIGLNHVLMPSMRRILEQEILKEYEDLKLNHGIDVQTTHSFPVPKYPTRNAMKYENINGNDTKLKPPHFKGYDYSNFDYKVTSHVDFAKLFLQSHMAKFNAFNESCDAPAVLNLFGRIPVFSAALRNAANAVRAGRNAWAHSYFMQWNETDFTKRFDDMMQLVSQVGLSSADEAKVLENLTDWKDKGVKYKEVLEYVSALSNDVKDEHEGLNKENQEPWKWNMKSIIHREKLRKLSEHGKIHPEEIKVVNGVRVCCWKEFLIGKGSDGTRVYIGLGKDGVERAVKRLPKDSCYDLAEQEKKVLNELSTAKSINVVNYWFLEEQSDKNYLFLILDLCEETLADFVGRTSLNDLIKIVADIIRQILKGLADLHRDPNPILHRDLKPSNIMRNVQGNWLLADFGISRILTGDNSTHASTQRGTEYWRAVESYPSNGMTDDGKVRYKKESDIQVAGMVAYYIATKGEHPFGERPDRLRNLLDGNPVSLEGLKDGVLTDLLSWMLSHDSKKRPSAEQALKHPYLQPAKQNFQMLGKVGNQPEIKTQDVKSDVVRMLNSDPKDWRNQIEPDILEYLSTDSLRGRTVRYKSSLTDCLRLIRNIQEHWHDRPRPRPEAFYFVGDPQEYFLNLFPNLPFEVHRIVRSCDWRERSGLKEYFM